MLTALEGAYGDSADAVTVAGRTASYEELLGAAGAVAADVAGAPAFAVTATASLETVAAVVGGLLAGVPCVPLPPDAGPAEREHILRDSGAAEIAVDFARRADAPSGKTAASEDPALILYTSG
ncbi:acyl-CoA synthetase, partial [Streptomyces sp. NPDC059233]